MKKDKRALIFDRLAPVYDNHMVQTGHVRAEEQLLRGILSPIKNVHKILELACGTGISTGILHDILGNVEIIAVDISEKMIDTAKKKFSGNYKIRFVKMDAEFLNQLSIEEPFDLIVAVYGICWFDIKAIIPKIHDLLSEEGWVVILDDLDLPQPIFSMRFPNVAQLVSQVRKIVKKGELEDMFTRSGFRQTGSISLKVANTHTSYAVSFQKCKPA